jgi:uncharacterized protein YhfF
MEALVLKFWHTYVNRLPAGFHRQKMRPDMFSFGDSGEMADQLAMLVRMGVKTATCSTLWTYEEERKALPQRRDYSVVLDGNGAAVAVIETVEVFVTPSMKSPSGSLMTREREIDRCVLEASSSKIL